MKLNLTFSKLLLVPAAFLSIIIIGNSCQKSISNVPAADNAVNKQKLGITNDVLNASASDDENFDMVMGTGEYADASTGAQNAVANKLSGRTTTYSPSKDVYPHTKTIDYGTGWTDDNGVTKSGKVIITYFNPSTVTEGRYTLTNYDNYYVNGVHVEGHIRIHKTVSTDGRPVYAHFILKTLTDGSGNVKKYNGFSKWTLIDWQDGTNNAYQIREYNIGSELYNGVESSNFTTNVDKNNPVIKPISCRRVQGLLIAKIQIVNPSSSLEEHLDYGSGECDNMATLSINGSEPEAVSLPLEFWPLNL